MFLDSPTPEQSFFFPHLAQHLVGIMSETSQLTTTAKKSASPPRGGRPHTYFNNTDSKYSPYPAHANWTHPQYSPFGHPTAPHNVPTGAAPGTASSLCSHHDRQCSSSLEFRVPGQRPLRRGCRGIGMHLKSSCIRCIGRCRERLWWGWWWVGKLALRTSWCSERKVEVVVGGFFGIF